MKRIFFIGAVVAVSLACNSKGKDAATTSEKKETLTPVQEAKSITDSANFTTVKWYDTTTQYIGKVKEGEVVEVSFKFKNTGDKPLVISNVSASCGCTVPEKPEKAFAPGEEGEIRAKFDSHGKGGVNHKSVYVTANTKPKTTHELSFQVDVEVAQ